MKQQCLDHAITTPDLLCKLQGGLDEPKQNLHDLIVGVGQLGTALSFCWMLHSFI